MALLEKKFLRWVQIWKSLILCSSYSVIFFKKNSTVICNKYSTSETLEKYLELGLIGHWLHCLAFTIEITFSVSPLIHKGTNRIYAVLEKIGPNSVLSRSWEDTFDYIRFQVLCDEGSCIQCWEAMFSCGPFPQKAEISLSYVISCQKC